MSNKKRTNKRQIKRPSNYSDFVVGNLTSSRSNAATKKGKDDFGITELGENSGVMDDDKASGSVLNQDENKKTGGVGCMNDCGKMNGNGVQGSKENGPVMDNEINCTMDNQKECEFHSQSEPKCNVSQPSTPVNVQSSKTVKTSVEECGNNVSKNTIVMTSESLNVEKVSNKMNVAKSYADMLSKNEANGDNKLCQVPTVVYENGQEFVVFDEELVKEGSKKWELTACGYFVGYKMNIQELSYNLFRMWGKFGLKHILNNGNGVFVFKFNNEQGLQKVIESGPWIVNSKPMVVQKWDPSVNLDKTEPTTLPVWIKLMNIPLEAWSMKGLSALASRLGNPLIMDAMTNKMCNQGMGRLGYARVLVEINAAKVLVDSIDILYMNTVTEKQFVKKVKVEYDWKPPICSTCNVFGHSTESHKKTSSENNVQEARKEDEGFINKNRRYDTNKEGNIYAKQMRNTQHVERRNMVPKRVYIKKVNHEEKANETQATQEQQNTQNEKDKRNVWNVNDKIVEEVRGTVSETNKKETSVQKEKQKESISKHLDELEQNEVKCSQEKSLDGKSEWKASEETIEGVRTSNKFASLQEEYNVDFLPIPNSEYQYATLMEEYKKKPDLFLLWKKEEILVDKLVNSKMIPTIEETKRWPLCMFMYYKDGWEAKWKTECPFIGNFQE